MISISRKSWKGWETKTSEVGQNYIFKAYLNINTRIWLHFINHNLMPSSHSSDITPTQDHLLYLLIKQKSVRLQDIIFASIKEVAHY
ncbi:uncharacterized protein G2W53_034930 [Senna tora]|uniref:Putative plant transposon protein domain-containing protein n=1 Tax=Senna tora TaxID=362788 RepID=A0A834SUW7_9FABA|nr:uncharacterized protein G2W53_034930 [Senna tora]